eukprot:TRINITY_DN7087_c1_g1_i3.p1 TRINITY_DN7087_c1_g1~~TRINITY_DN7087_c1_g1_i3.p1  ORF type:complete len:357 (+),score=82.06 TRINITY_DN7087_c1_g1_i3:140-1072(+)
MDQNGLTWKLWFSMDQITTQTFLLRSDVSDVVSGSYSVQSFQTQTPNPINFKTSDKTSMTGVFQMNADRSQLILAIPCTASDASFQNLRYKDNSILIRATRLPVPDQIHLTYGEDPQTSIVVSWATRTAAGSYVVYHQDQSNNSIRVHGTSRQYQTGEYQSWFLHRVAIANLLPNTKYTYRCGEEHNWSDRWHFTTAPGPSDEIQVTMFADINLGGSLGGSLGAWKNSTDCLYAMSQENSQFIFHSGDIAYCVGDQVCWDHHFQAMQPVAATQAYMTSMGNHDVFPEDIGDLKIQVEEFKLKVEFQVESE